MIKIQLSPCKIFKIVHFKICSRDKLKFRVRSQMGIFGENFCHFYGLSISAILHRVFKLVTL